jgi:RNA polymerase sigma-70 factor (ECF subfamily)
MRDAPFGIAITSILGSTGRVASASLGRSEDAELFDRFLAGDDAVAVKLFRKYNTRLFLYCAKMLRSNDQAEDITQEIWERLIRLRAKPEQVGNLAGLLFTMARNLCLNQIRNAGRSVPLGAIAESAHPSTTIPGSTDIEETVLSALDSLGFEDRELLILNIYCGYRLDEIATMLEISPNAAWTRASRARARMRRIIADMGDEERGPGTGATREGGR